MGKAKTERRKARVWARPLALSRMDGRDSDSGSGDRIRLERLHGTHVPARVVERMGGGTRGVRVSEGDSGPRMRPTRKPRTAGSDAAAAGITGRGYGSKGDGVKRLTGEQIRANRDRFFAEAARRRDARAADVVSRPVPSGEDVVAQARADYRYAVGRAHERRAAGDASGAAAWMSEARRYRRVFRNA